MIAINRKWKNKHTGQMQEEVSFIEIVAWGRTAETCAEYLKKGRPVFVEGRLTQDRWESPEGKKMSKLKVTAEQVTFLGSGRGTGAGTGQGVVDGTAADTGGTVVGEAAARGKDDPFTDFQEGQTP